MNRVLNGKLIVGLIVISILAACKTSESVIESEPESALTALSQGEPRLADIPQNEAHPILEPQLEPELVFAPLPLRAGPVTQTSGTVPHVQIGVEMVLSVNEELHRLSFSLPDVENIPTTVSLPGARGMWLGDEISLSHPEVIVSGREFAHIHPDGSLHLSLPYERALEAVEKGWAERHPWADDRDGWEGFVMLFTPQSMEELDTVFQLILDSYNFVTGRSISKADL